MIKKQIIIFIILSSLLINITHQACHGSCDTCAGGTTCGCTGAKYLTNSDTECAACDPACTGCTDGTTNTCSGCNNGWYHFGGNQCIGCHTNCAICNDGTNTDCSECKPSYYLTGTSCVTAGNCPVGTWEDTPNKQCTDCSTPCASCVQNAGINNNCLTCEATYYLNSVLATDQCVTSGNCPVGTWEDTPNKKCEDCTPACASCVQNAGASNNCLSCEATYYLNTALSANQCVTTGNCPLGTWEDIPNKKCEDCSAPCASCVQVSAVNNNCLSCENTYFLNSALANDQCVTSGNCPTGTWEKSATNMCEDCSAPCASCVQNAGIDNNCLTCEATYYLNTALSTNQCVTTGNCPLGTWEDIPNKKCEDCSTPCASCVQVSAVNNNCLTCENTYFLDSALANDQCVTSGNCPAGTWEKSATNMCEDCSAPCASCVQNVGIDNNCLTCENTYFLNSALATDQCVTTGNCPTGKWENSSTNICDDCRVGCLTCVQNAGVNNNCLTCGATYYYDPNVALDQCVTVTGCSINTYPDGSTWRCEDCHANCARCLDNSQFNCQECRPGFYLTGSTCVASGSCPSGTWEDTPNKKCEICSTPCLSCVQTAGVNNNCLTCKASFYFDSTKSTDQCVIDTACPSDTWPNSGTNICETCHTNCAECDAAGNNNCQKCNANFFLEVETCDATCPPKNYEDNVNWECVDCDIKCSVCTGPATTCTACEDTYFLHGTTCDSTCPAKYWKEGPPANACRDCDTLCALCDTSGSDCSQCVPGGFLDGNTCQPPGGCPTGTWEDGVNHLCATCDTECSQCSTSGSTCQACNDGWFHYAPSEECRTSCPNPYFEKGPADNKCEGCDPKCSECDGTPTNCQACNPGWYHDASTDTCVDSTGCPAATWPDGSTNICQPCDTACALCTTSATTCTKCNDGWFLNAPTSCLTTCPPGDAPQPPPANSCQTCDPTCTTCFDTGVNQCTTCTGTRYKVILDNTCVLDHQCGHKKFANNADPNDQLCSDCDSTCYECTGTATHCTECNGLYLDTLTNTCVDPCPSVHPNGYWYKLAPDWLCVACDSACGTCNGLTGDDCITCAVGKHKILGTNTCITCPPGEFGNDISGYCEGCHTNCATCHGATEFLCDSCNTGFYLNPDLSSATECKDRCEGTQLCTDTPRTIFCKPDPDNKCVSCHSTCLTCHNDLETGCDSCLADPMDMITDRHLWITQCVENCPSNMYVKMPENECDLCDNKCTTCQNDKDECYGCTANHHLLGTVCRDNGCPEKYWADDSIWECVSCHTTCKTCNPSSAFNQCTSCENGRYLYLGECLLTCYDNWWADDSDNTCQPCFSGCYLCSGSATFCTQCVDGYFLFGNVCQTWCPTFSDPSLITPEGPPTNQCVSYTCTDVVWCLECNFVSRNVCTKCKPGSVLWQSVCVTNCGVGMYIRASDSTCQYCDLACVQCVNAANECSVCHNGYYLQPNLDSCGPQCLDNWYKVGPPTNECYTCHAKCLTCDGGLQTDCLTCYPGNFFKDNECFPLSTCPTETFGHTDLNECVDCVFPCKTCLATGNTGEACQTCEPGFFFYSVDLTCVSSCIPGWIGNPANDLCEECHADCLYCNGVAFNQCTKCSLGSKFGPFLLNGECLYPCPDGYFQNIRESTCDLCDNKCHKCFNEGPDSCLSCAPAYFYLDHQCLVECGKGYYADVDKNCIKCDDTCEECNGPGRHKCTVCPLTRIKEDTTCKECIEFYGMEDDPSIPQGVQMQCREICGDGKFVTNTYQCDDGNVLDNDGCSSTCQLEPGFWRCVNGTYDSPHVCYDYRDIGFFILYESEDYLNYKENVKVTFQLSFNKTFVLPSGQYLEDYLSFGFPDMEERYPYKLSKILNPENNDNSTDNNNSDGERRMLQLHTGLPLYQVELVLNQTIKNRPITAFISNSEIFSDGFGQGLSYGVKQALNPISKYIYYTDSERSNSALFKKVILFCKIIFIMLFIFTILIIFIVSIVIMLFITFTYFWYRYHINQFYNVWLTLDLMQTLFYFRFVNIRWPLNLLQFFDNQENFVHMHLYNFFRTNYENYDKFKPGYESFYRYEKDVLFFNNAGSITQVFLLLFCSFWVVKFLGSKSEQNLKIQPFFRRIYLGYFKFSLVIDFLLGAFGVFVPFAIFQLTRFDRATDFILAIILMVLCIYCTVYFFIKLFRNREDLYVQDNITSELEDESLEHKISIHNQTFFYRNLYIHTRFEENSYKIFITFFLLFRKLQLPFSLLILHDWQKLLISTQIFWHAIMLGVHLKFKIFLTNRNNWRLIFSEACMISALCMMYAIVQDEKEDETWKLYYCWIILFIFSGMLVINGIYLIFEIIILPVFFKTSNLGGTGKQRNTAVEDLRQNQILEIGKNKGKTLRTTQAQSMIFNSNKRLTSNGFPLQQPNQYMSQREMDKLYKESGIPTVNQLQGEEDNLQQVQTYGSYGQIPHNQLETNQVNINNPTHTSQNHNNFNFDNLSNEDKLSDEMLFEQNNSMLNSAKFMKDPMSIQSPSRGAVGIYSHSQNKLAQSANAKSNKNLTQYTLDSNRQASMQRQVNRVRPQTFIHNSMQSLFGKGKGKNKRGVNTQFDLQALEEDQRSDTTHE